MDLVTISDHASIEGCLYMQENHPNKNVHYITQEIMRGQSDALYLAREYLTGPMLMVWHEDHPEVASWVSLDCAFTQKLFSAEKEWIREEAPPQPEI